MRAVRVKAMMTVSVLVFVLLLPSQAVAWDSVPGDTSSHWYFVRDAKIELVAQDPTRYGELNTYLDQLHEGSNYEGSHSQRRDPSKNLVNYTYWADMAVGSNPGSNHPEYWWQTALHYYREYVTTGSDEKRRLAYLNLGRLIHLIEDKGVPAHAYHIMHGFGIGKIDNFEILAANNYYPEYYRTPDSTNYPGKNVLDTSTHGDDSKSTYTLRTGIENWTYLFETNLQAPGADRVSVSVSAASMWANPCFCLQFRYRTSDGNWATHETGEFCRDYWNWTTFRWDASFAPNTPFEVYYRRPESGSDRGMEFKIYVEKTEDVTNEISNPEYSNPWMYYGWLHHWTHWATQAPYWRRYYNEAARGDLEFDVTWSRAPNTERALLSLQDRLTREAVKWALQAAVAQFESLRSDPNSVTDWDALGQGYRVVLYDDWKYNSTGSESPEYIRSLPLVCEPLPCGVYVIDDLGWMGGCISSLEVRRATVVLYSNKNRTGTAKVFSADTSYVGDDFNDRAWSLKIIPAGAPLIIYELYLPDITKGWSQ